MSQLKSDQKLAEILASLAPTLNTDFLQNILRGIEKENLRVTKQLSLVQTPHPIKLGKALTNPSITLDFSEALVEMITPPLQGYAALNQYLLMLNRFILDHISPEMLWPLSMPPHIDDERDIILAEFGQSNIAQMKHIYRVGLSHRYGRIMQAIAGIHYNISFPDSLFQQLQILWQQQTKPFGEFRSCAYMKLIRNFYRFAWLLPYLFGASPICANTSVGADVEYLQALDADHQVAPFGTSLRMSDLGYQNNAQDDLVIDINSVTAYARSLYQATHTHSDEFADIDIKKNGHYQQLNQNILQIENEYYSFIRPKALPVSGEPPSVSLCCNGIDYIEVRLFDLNPLVPLGIDVHTQAFMDVFLLFCLLTDDYTADKNSIKTARNNFQTVCTRGREPGLMLEGQCTFKTEATKLLADLAKVANVLDENSTTSLFQTAVTVQLNKINDPALTPSATILNILKDENLSYLEFCQRQVKDTTAKIMQKEPDAELYQHLATEVSESITQWKTQEQQPNDFDAFLTDYMTKKHHC